jgi:spore maturation protein CgeB
VISSTLKFFLSFLQGKPDHPIPAYSFWEYYIKKGIEEAGHQWTECNSVDWAYGLVPMDKNNFNQWEAISWEQTLAYLKTNPVDIFLSYLYPHQVNKTAIREIQKMGIPCVNFFCDNVREFVKIPEEFSIFNLNWVPEYKAIKMYKAAGYPYIYLPMPMWVSPELRVIKQKGINRISFIGSHDIQRQLLFEDVLNKQPNLDLDIYGAGWIIENFTSFTLPESKPYSLTDKLRFQYTFLKKQGVLAYIRKMSQRNNMQECSPLLSEHLKGKPDFETYIRISQESQITIGINRYPSFRYPLKNPDTYSRLRDIEAPMLGACYLTEWTEGLDQQYDIGNEIETYTNVKELIEKIKILQTDAFKRNKLRIRGQKRALNFHSIPNSIKIILLKLK